MGAASSVGPSKAHGRRIESSDESRNAKDEKDSDAASEFSACARILASKYRGSRLRVDGGLFCEEQDYMAAPDAVSIPNPSSLLENGSNKISKPRSGCSLSRSFSPPPPRAERKRLSRQMHPGASSCLVNGDNAKLRHDPAPVTALSASLATQGQERRRAFVHREEMLGLARDLGYAVTPIQATTMFDMLDLQGHGRIAKDELMKHFLPLLHGIERSTSGGEGYFGLRKSEHKLPRRPRPSSPPPATVSPPRPAGEPPPRPVGEPSSNAKRRFTLPIEVGSGKHPASMSTSNSKESSALRGKPAKFWMTRPIGGSDDAINSFPPMEDVGCEKWGENSGRDQDAHDPYHRRKEGGRVRQWSSKGQEHSAVTIRGSGDWERITIPEGTLGTTAADAPEINNRGTGNATTTTTAAATSEENQTNNGGDFCENNGTSHSKISLRGESTFAEPWARRSMAPILQERRGRPAMRHCSVTTAVAMPAPRSEDNILATEEVCKWTAADVLTWLKTLPRGLGAFAEADAFLNGRVDGKRLATLTLSDLKRKEFHHAKFKAKVPTALWVEIKRIQPSASIAALPVSSRFSMGESIVDEATRTTLCTVTRFVGQGAFGEVYQVVWKGVGTDWGSTMAMKTVRLAEVSSDKRDEYRVLLVEEILTAVRVKPHPNVVNVRFAHIMGFCSKGEEYLCFEDFVTGRDLGDLIAERKGTLYEGTTAEVQGRLLSYSIQLARGLGHIHRCGVLHQDIKSANVMVSTDGLMLITDFGFATVGHFGPPPPPTTTASPTAEPELTIYPNETVNTTATREVEKEDPPRLETAIEEGEGRGLVVAPSKTYERRQSRPSNNGNRELPESRAIMAVSDAYGDARASQATDAGAFNVISKGKYDTARNAIDTPVRGTQQHENRGEDTAKYSPRSQHHGTPNNGVQSQLFKGVKGTGSNESFRNETKSVGEYEGESSKAKGEDRGGENGLAVTPPSRDRVLFGTLKGFTPRYQSPEICAIMAKKTKAAYLELLPSSQNGRHSQKCYVASQPNSASKTPFTHKSDMWAAGVIILEMYAGGLMSLRAGRGENAGMLHETLIQSSDRNCSNRQDIGNEDDKQNDASTSECGGTSNITRGGVEVGQNTGNHDSRGRNKMRQEGECFRVTMPADVRELLREIFRRDSWERPASMQAVAARLSQTLRGMLQNGEAVVPCPTPAAPTPLSLCEDLPPYIEAEENHGKVGRLHMWLGKALFLKGEDRRGQALQEYREGVRVLEQSNADRGSPSMALFCWYLGTALLDASEINEALPHLTEAVLIDPDNAKYRYALGVAKRAIGDEAGARQDLHEAALLDEEDAEYRYQLRVQRNSAEQQRVDDQQCGSVEAKNHEAPTVLQGALPSDEEVDKTEATSAGKDSFPSLKSPNSRRQALEAAAASPARISGLEGLHEYRAGKGGGVGGFGRGGGGDGTDSVGGKHANRVGNISEVRHFSVGDKICCGRSVISAAAVKPLEPMRCYSSCVDHHVDGSGTFVIDGLLAVDQASVHFRGEAYTATALRRAAETENDDDATNHQAYNIVHIRFERDKEYRPVTATTQAPTSPATSIGEQTRAAAAAATNVTMHVNEAASDNCGNREAWRIYPPSDDVHGRPSKKGMMSTSSRSRSPVGFPSKLETDVLPTLKAIARSAMVGFHTGLAGAMRDFIWTKRGITLVVDAVPSGCCTLRESLSGRLHQVPGIGRREGKQGSDATGAAGVVERMLNLARQIAAAISRCHQRGVLLQDITPDEVLVTPRWEVLLRPNYAHAREGYAWTTFSVRETAVRGIRQQRARLRRSSLGSHNESLTAFFSDTTSPNYQSPEIAQIRRENQRLHRVSGRALRRLVPSLPSSPPASSPTSHEPRLEMSPTSTPPPATSDTTHETPVTTNRDRLQTHMNRSTYAGEKTTLLLSRNSHATISSDEDSGLTDLDRSKRIRRIGDGRGTQIRRDISDSPCLLSPLRQRRSTSGAGGGDGVSDLVRDNDHGTPTVSPRTSDIWAWALIVLQMFSDEAWASGSGQTGLTALESLLRRKRGVDTWTTDGVVSWLHDVGLWSEGTERQMRAFKIAGPQLLVPSCRRDIVGKLGLFILDGELAHKLWDKIAGGLQRWAIPPRLAQILRRCLADSPDDRFSSMDEVCELLRGVTADNNDGANVDASSTVPATSRSQADGGEDTAANSLRAGMILNDIGVCLHGKGLHEEAERHYKMALLATEDIPEPYYNLGLLYASPGFDKFKEAQQGFETAMSLMEDGDPHRRVGVEHARAAQRKSNYYQSHEVMQALSGKYKRVSSNDPRGGTSSAGGVNVKVQPSARSGQP